LGQDHVVACADITLLLLLIYITMTAWLIKMLLIGDAMIHVHVWIEPVSTGSEAGLRYVDSLVLSK
jgi:hypothetical protein